jgi:hypothetical protein
MRLLTAAGDQLRRADGLPAVLDAACDAFEDILAIIGACEDTTASTATAIVFLLAATQAANGRDAVLFAPSLPPRSLRPRPTTEPAEQADTGDITTAVAGLSWLLASRLAATAAIAVAAADRAACHDAARCARQVADLLTGENL